MLNATLEARVRPVFTLNLLYFKTGKPRNRKKGATRYRGAHTTATEQTNHKPEGTKRASGMPTRASKHKQGMERPEPAAANDTRKQGPRTD